VNISRDDAVELVAVPPAPWRQQLFIRADINTDMTSARAPGIKDSGWRRIRSRESLPRQLEIL